MSPQPYRRSNDERRPFPVVAAVLHTSDHLKNAHRYRAEADVMEAMHTRASEIMREMDAWRCDLEHFIRAFRQRAEIEDRLAGVRRGSRNDGNYGGGA